MAEEGGAIRFEEGTAGCGAIDVDICLSLARIFEREWGIYKLRSVLIADLRCLLPILWNLGDRILHRPRMKEC